VINTGKTHLGSLRVTTAELNYTNTLTGVVLAPQASRMIFVNGKIPAGPLTNNAVVVGMPVQPNGSPIIDATNVMSNDPSNVVPLTPIPRINITNVVYIGNDNGAQCNTGVEKVVGYAGTGVVYCFRIINTGDTHLKNPVLTNPKLNGYSRTFTLTLPPGESVSVAVAGNITTDLDNLAIVSASPVLPDGNPIVGVSDVTNSDPSGVTVIVVIAKITVDNTVYIGRDGGKQCGTPTAVDYVSGQFGTNITYCFKVRSIGLGRVLPISANGSDLTRFLLHRLPLGHQLGRVPSCRREIDRQRAQ
jgi:hypothetical protein